MLIAKKIKSIELLIFFVIVSSEELGCFTIAKQLSQFDYYFFFFAAIMTPAPIIELPIKANDSTTIPACGRVGRVAAGGCATGGAPGCLGGEVEGVDGRDGGVDGSAGGDDEPSGGVDGSAGGVDGSTGGVDGSAGGVDEPAGGVDESDEGVDDGGVDVRCPLIKKWVSSNWPFVKKISTSYLPGVNEFK